MRNITLANSANVTRVSDHSENELPLASGYPTMIDDDVPLVTQKQFEDHWHARPSHYKGATN